MIQEPYGLTVATVMSVVTAEKAIKAALAEEGFGILSEIDVAATFAEKLGIDHKPYKILGACNPDLAHRALDADDRIGLLLPCNVVVAETDDGSTMVSVLDPAVIEQIADDEAIADIAADARSRLVRALQKIDTVHNQCIRLENLLNDFLKFARLGRLDLRAGNLNEQIARVLDLFEAQADENKIEILRYLDADLPSVQINSETLHAYLVVQ